MYNQQTEWQRRRQLAVRDYLEKAAAAIDGMLVDNCFIILKAAKAAEICVDKKLPRFGMEKQATWGEYSGWVMQTSYATPSGRDCLRWSVMVTLPARF